MLTPLAAIADLLVDPIARSPITLDFDAAGSLLRCRGHRGDFPLVDGRPVLLPVGTLANPSEIGRSQIARGHGVFWTRLSRWVNGGDQAAARNLPALIALARELRRRPRVLVVGGGAIAYGSERLYTDPEVDLVAFDIYVSPQVQLVADAHAMPFKDGSFDAVAIQAVLEHVLDPRQVVAEIRRVLRDDGLVYAETPFLQQVHEGAFDFQRYTERGHRWLFRDFAQIATGEVAGAGTATFWSVRYLIGGLVRSRRIGNLIAAPLFVLRFLDLLVAPGHGLDASSATYFLGRKASRAIDAAELARGFRGAR